MSLTPAALKTELPEFTSVADATVQKWLDRAARMLNPDAWGSLYDDGHLFLTAHLMALMGVASGVTASSGGVIASKTVGPVTVTYASPSGTTPADADLERTKYGQQYKAMRRTLVKSPMVL